ncbi:MAG: COG1615 family transporter [Dactylosporangium sp.]|nr:COG1615 family transporter [Dactylosporangium sp.]
MSRRGRVTIAVLAGLLLIFTLFGRIVDAWADWLWYREVDYSTVFTTALTTRLLLFFVVGIVVGGLVAANLYLAYRVRPLLRPHSAEQHALDRYRLALLPRLGTWIALTSVVVGLFAGLSAQGRWQDWLLFVNSQPFGKTDPQFNIDISFYVFRLPFWQYLVGVGFVIVVLSVLGAVSLHYLFGGVRLQGAGDRMTTAARAHLTSLVAAFVALKAIAYFLDRRALVLSHNESIDIWGGGYTDINALLPAKEILAWISVLVALAILVFSNAFARNLLWPGLALGLLAVSAIAVGGIYPSVVQSFTVKPSPLAKETPYIERSIAATRDAYGLTDVEMTDYPGNNQVPPADLATDQATISTIRLLDPHVVGPTYTQNQQVRGFYEFNEQLDIDRYTIDGQVQDYVVGVREINYASQIVNSNWQNRHTIYTHGYGFVGAPANQVVCNGQPFFVSGFLNTQSQEESTSGGERCASTTDLIPTTQPRIYYGEQMADYAVIGKEPGGKDAEFDRPSGETDAQYVTYDGDGGVPVGSLWRRMLYGTYFRETNFLLSSVFNENSKLLYLRDPAERVHKVAPFLTLDGDPYPAVVDGKILWILDGYTTASTYPYSQVIDWRTATRDTQTQASVFPEARQDVNYVRNSVKATVDAHTGKVTLYAFDESDPVLKVWNKAFGSKLVKPRGEMSAELLGHMRYPEDQFKVQRDLLAKFHVKEAKGFFSGDDFWQVPVDPARQNSGLNQPPYYLLAKFPGQDEPTFQLTAPVNPRNRQNLAALISGSYVDGRPHLKVLQLPSDTRIDGPGQVWQKLTTYPPVTTDLALFERENSQPVHGNLLSLPVADGMLYVEPLYIQNKSTNPQPLVRKVLLYYGKRIAYADSLEAGLQELVKLGAEQQTPGEGDEGTEGGEGGEPETPSTEAPATGAVAEAVANLNRALDDLHKAQESGDFEAYGKALKAVEDAVKAYQDAQAAAGGQAPAPEASAEPEGGSTPGAAGAADTPAVALGG